MLNRIHFAYYIISFPLTSTAFPLAVIHATFYTLLSLVLFLYMNFCGYIE